MSHDTDDDDLPAPGVLDSELAVWFQRKFGRRASGAELMDLLVARARSRRRKVLRWRAGGADEKQLVDKLLAEFLASREALQGAALTAAALTALAEFFVGAVELSLIDYRRYTQDLFADSQDHVVQAAYEYCEAKLDGGTIDPNVKYFLSWNMIAAINAGTKDELTSWSLLLSKCCRGLASAQERALAKLAVAGRQAREDNRDIQAQLATPEPGAPRALVRRVEQARAPDPAPEAAVTLKPGGLS
jgi:hypothetical protein